MGEASGRRATGEVRTDRPLGDATARPFYTLSTGGSPAAVEATLASISAEVTAEAVERLERAAMAKAQGGR